MVSTVRSFFDTSDKSIASDTSHNIGIGPREGYKETKREDLRRFRVICGIAILSE